MLNVEFCMFAPSNIRANMAEAEELICEIYLCPATVFWEGGGHLFIKAQIQWPNREGYTYSTVLSFDL